MWGGAIGVWAKEFLNCGIEKVRVIDGPWIDKTQLLISEDQFTVFDLGSGKPYHDKNKYDIACSFECAEHISKDYADLFVENLVNLSDIIIFSAAIPGQGGDYHINEQKQSYWINKFKERGYIAIDPIRGYIEDNKLVQPFYKQNILIYIKESIDWPETIKKYKGIPYVKDVILEPYMGFKISDKSDWKHIFLLQKLIIKAIIRKCLRK